MRNLSLKKSVIIAMFVAVEVKSARHVAGFGAARSIDGQEIWLALGSARVQS